MLVNSKRMALYSKRISLLLLLLLLLNLTELSITPHTPFSSSEVVHGQLRKKPPGVASSGAEKTFSWRRLLGNPDRDVSCNCVATHNH